MLRTTLARLLAVFSSLGTSCALLVMLGVLTWLGTLEQTRTGLFEVQRKYFESFVLLHDLGPFSIPLPGATLVMALLFANLLVGGIVRLRKGWSTAGILIAHLGIALLFASALVKHRYSEDGHVTLHEGERADHFESWVRWELALIEDLGGGRVCEHLASHEQVEDTRHGPVHLRFAGAPFEIAIDKSFANCRPERADPTHASALLANATDVVEGVRLVERPQDAQAEANIAGMSLAVVDAANGVRRATLVWGAESAPFTFLANGKRWAITLRKERHPMPFAVELERFTKEDHPRSDMPKSFASDVKLVSGASERDVRISMNEPLRSGGLVVYQASWGPSNARPGDRLYSTFAVVRNPADHWPLIACLVIAAGLILHFARKLVRFVRLEARGV